MLTLTIVVSLFATLVASAYWYVKKSFSYWKQKGVPYIEPSFPFGNFSNLYLGKEHFGDVVAGLYNLSSERFVGVYTSLRPILLIRDPALIKDMAIKNFHHFDQRTVTGNAEADPMANNILLQNGEKWKHMRAQLSPAFSSGKLKGMFSIIVDCGKSLDEYINTFADTDNEVEIRDVFARFSTNVIASVAFGIDINCIKNPDNEFRKYGQRIFKPTLANILRVNINIWSPKLSKMLGLRFVDKEIGDFMIETVRQNMEYREKNNISRKDIFQLLMQLRNTGQIQEGDDWSAKAQSDKKSLTLEEMAAQAFVFYGGGFESSSSAMSFLMYELAKHPDEQQKAYEDIVNVLQQHNGQLTYDSMADMKYVNACLDESLRLYPPFPIITRNCAKDYQIPGTEVIIEKGKAVFFPTLALHHDPKYWKDPLEFKPERFIDSANMTFEERPNLTFGEGPRNCIAQRLGRLQSKIAIIILLQKFKFELADEHKNTDLKIVKFGIVLAPLNGVKVKVFKR